MIPQSHLRAIACALILGLTITSLAEAQQKVLFIRGGSGTVGFFEGGADEQGADINNYATTNGNHGWGELHAALIAEGFDVEQLSEDPVTSASPYNIPTPVALDAIDLSQYAVIVFGSNNAEYTTAQVNAFMTYIQNGGAGLFISDANFGQFWGDAPSSDQLFLSRFGLTMNQDQGTYDIRRTDEFLVPAHPILNGVNSFDGEGVSPISITSTVTDITSTILTSARGSVRRNTGDAQGPSESSTVNDGTLVIATYGTGRVAGHFDRNTFFNDNGAGTNINRFENEQYARNLFNWLAGNPDFEVGVDNYAPRVHFPDIADGTVLTEGSDISVDAIAKDIDGTVSYVDLFLDDQLVARDSSSPYSWSGDALLQDLTAGTRVLKTVVTDNDGDTTESSIELTVQDGSGLENPLDRSFWNLSSSVNNSNELANAIDGDTSTRWPTRQFQTPGQTFTVDFTERQLIHRILLETVDNPEDYPRGYIVRGSNNGTDYTEIISGSGNGATTSIELSQPVTYRYIQIEQTGSSNNRWWSIHEINIYKPPTNSVLNSDSWLQFYFGDDLDDLTKESTHWGTTADFDNDGLNTLEELAFNSNPLIASSSNRPILVGQSFANDSINIQISYRQWKDGAGSPGAITANGINYNFEFSPDLETSSWTTAGITVQQVGDAVDNSDGTETVTLQVTPPVTSPERGFFRLNLTQD
ncbi:discoidin domain-containing protein [Rubellicoccus peritrichatus]|uniref:Discoidin domain-containing protein n=1 Tax=Rubellicoccus peritrichatus TaxID=3080537 RepID=A0AAQ3L9T7_9BACT|nr:discoidin domain-containing protein [Puniceicoccus sp. CR14]WOO40584.1 discoidin domain-containing protein [Puniceicoccus sp. CR14]